VNPIGNRSDYLFLVGAVAVGVATVNTPRVATG
jgi:hypothetical protein